MIVEILTFPLKDIFIHEPLPSPFVNQPSHSSELYTFLQSSSSENASDEVHVKPRGDTSIEVTTIIVIFPYKC